MKYRLRTNSEGKFQAQYNDAIFPFPWGWCWISNPKGNYQIEFDTMDEALEAIAEHKRKNEAEKWTVIDLPD